MVEWFRRKSEKIKTLDKKEIAEGMWLKCPQCQEVLYRTMLEDSQYVCTNCTHHFRIDTDDYIKLIIDKEYSNTNKKQNILIVNLDKLIQDISIIVKEVTIVNKVLTVNPDRKHLLIQF